MRRPVLAALGLLLAGSSAVAAEGDLDQKYFTRDPNEVVITDIAGWSHPAKTVLQKHKLTLTKVELEWDKKFPVFHVATFGADPTSHAADPSFLPLLQELLTANAKWPYKLVSDDEHDGFLVLWDAKKKAIRKEVLQDEDP